MKFSVNRFIESLADDFRAIDTIGKLIVAYSNDSPSFVKQEHVLFGVPIWYLMPICAINFESGAHIRNQEINAIASHSGFLNEFDSEGYQGFPDARFEMIFASETPIAGKATELPICIARKEPESCSAASTISVLRWASAFFGAVMPIQILFRAEHFSASLARYILSGRQPTFSTTNGIPVRRGCEYGKGFSASRANFFDAWSGFAKTFPGAINLSTSNASGREIECASALWTRSIFSKSSSFLRGKSKLFICGWHVEPFTIDFVVLYRRLFSMSKVVLGAGA